MIVAVASGKGGTGKTTVAVNLAAVWDGPVQLADCDVEEPNAHLFIGGEVESSREAVIRVPEVDGSLCDGCGACGRFCAYGAIVSFGAEPLVFPEMCHGCGGCAMVCPRRAIREVPRRIGAVESQRAGALWLVRGCLDVGNPMAPPLIREVKAGLRAGVPVIIDAPPGTSCPVVAALNGADLAVLVTEPTPFGLSDLKLAVDVIGEMGLPFGVVINRAGTGEGGVRAFCAERGIPVLLEIPDDRRIAEAYSRGELVVEALPGYRRLFTGLAATIEDMIDGKGRPVDAHV